MISQNKKFPLKIILLCTIIGTFIGSILQIIYIDLHFQEYVRRIIPTGDASLPLVIVCSFGLSSILSSILLEKKEYQVILKYKTGKKNLLKLDEKQFQNIQLFLF